MFKIEIYSGDCSQIKRKELEAETPEQAAQLIADTEKCPDIQPHVLYQLLEYGEYHGSQHYYLTGYA